MAMVTSRSGQENGTGDQNALFLKKFAGEVLSVFEENNVMMPLHTVRTIESGKSAQFPAIKTASATYHTPGNSLITDTDADSSNYLSNIKHNEIVVTINDLLVSSCFIPRIDEAKNHYDVRGEYTRQMGAALAIEADKTLINYGLIGARATTDRFGGTDYIGETVDMGTTVSGDDLLENIVIAARTLDEKDIPSNDRYCVLTPANYYLLVEENKDAINRDYGNDGNGSLASGVVMSVAGIRLFKSNHLPTADWAPADGDLGTATDASYDFDGSATTPHALIFHRSALATVKLLDLAVETDYQVERQGTLMVAKYAMGHDILRNEALVELAV